MIALSQGSSCSGYAGEGIHNNTVCADQPEADKRGECQDGRSRVASRVRHKSGIAYLLCVQFGQTVDRLRQQFRRVIMNEAGPIIVERRLH